MHRDRRELVLVPLVVDVRPHLQRWVEPANVAWHEPAPRRCHRARPLGHLRRVPARRHPSEAATHRPCMHVDDDDRRPRAERQNPAQGALEGCRRPVGVDGELEQQQVGTLLWELPQDAVLIKLGPGGRQCAVVVPVAPVAPVARGIGGPQCLYHLDMVEEGRGGASSHLVARARAHGASNSRDRHALTSLQPCHHTCQALVVAEVLHATADHARVEQSVVVACHVLVAQRGEKRAYRFWSLHPSQLQDHGRRKWLRAKASRVSP